MRITNINVPEILVEKVMHSDVIPFIYKVISPVERHYSCLSPHHFLLDRFYRRTAALPHAPIRKLNEFEFENIACFLHTIPIYLRDTRPETVGEDDNIIDALGAYFPNRQNDDPYIELFLSPIEKAAGGNMTHFRWLFTMTLLHELAHAALDTSNYFYNRGITNVSTRSTFGHWLEESIANAAALHIINCFGDRDFYDFTRQFMLSQPEEYALGVLMEEHAHRGLYEVYRCKEFGVNPHLQNEWLDYVKGNPDTEELHNWHFVLTMPTSYSFRGKYFWHPSYLVYAVVLAVLSDHFDKTGTKMTIAEFQRLFPCITVSDRPAYGTMDLLNETSKDQPLDLADGTLYLSNLWSTLQQVMEFLGRTSCCITVYRIINGTKDKIYFPRIV